MHGPTCIFWANLTPFSLQALDLPPANVTAALNALPLGSTSFLYQVWTADWDPAHWMGGVAEHVEFVGYRELIALYKVRKTPSWPRSWANFSILQLYSHRRGWANLHLLGQPNTFLATRAHLHHAFGLIGTALEKD